MKLKVHFFSQDSPCCCSCSALWGICGSRPSWHVPPGPTGRGLLLSLLQTNQLLLYIVFREEVNEMMNIWGGGVGWGGH
uniref:Uncharacterized protein n=1 Tax=Fundulus heteroclitus TaxID=8078 RepID=A0A3Q2PRL3_FUNHE